MSSTSPYRLLLAEAWGRAAEPARALAVADEALAFVAATGEAEYEAELHRVRGEQLHVLGDREAAVVALRTAVDVARRGQATLLAARPRSSLRALDPVAGDDGAACRARPVSCSTSTNRTRPACATSWRRCPLRLDGEPDDVLEVVAVHGVRRRAEVGHARRPAARCSRSRRPSPVAASTGGARCPRGAAHPRGRSCTCSSARPGTPPPTRRQPAPRARSVRTWRRTGPSNAPGGT